MENLKTPLEAARYLRLEPASLANMRAQRRGPAFVRLSGRCVRYLTSDLDAWLQSRRHGAEPK